MLGFITLSIYVVDCPTKAREDFISSDAQIAIKGRESMFSERCAETSKYEPTNMF